jgi:hypothetical protein
MTEQKVVTTAIPVSPFVGRAGGWCVSAAALVLLSQMMRLGVGLLLGADPASTAHTLTYAIALLGMCALLLALTALYMRAFAALGRLGWIGYLLAFLGTLMIAGDWWFEAFVVPLIATYAPGVIDMVPAGSLLAGAIATVGAYSIGWTLFGLAALRAAVFARPAALLLLVSGVIGPLALGTPYQVPLALAIGWIGMTLTASRRQSGPTPSPPDSPQP